MSDEVNLDELPNEPLIFEVIMEGAPMTPEALIIGALVRRLGGAVVISPSELEAVQGVVIQPTSEGMRVDSGNI